VSQSNSVDLISVENKFLKTLILKTLLIILQQKRNEKSTLMLMTACRTK